jgi:hypothetical protein
MNIELEYKALMETVVMEMLESVIAIVHSNILDITEPFSSLLLSSLLL